MKYTTWKLFNALLGLSLLLPWIACIVGFTAPLARGTPRASPLKMDSGFHWDRMSGSGLGRQVDLPWEEATQTRVDRQTQGALDVRAMRESAKQCATGGRALVGLLAVSFILLTIALAMFIARLAGLLSTAGSLPAELGLAALSFVLMSLAIIIWGTMCYGSLDQWADNARPTSYVYIVLSTIFLLGALPLLGYMLNYARKRAAPGVTGSPGMAEPWRRSSYGGGVSGYKGRETRETGAAGASQQPAYATGPSYTATSASRPGERSWPEKTGVSL